MPKKRKTKSSYKADDFEGTKRFPLKKPVECKVKRFKNGFFKVWLDDFNIEARGNSLAQAVNNLNTVFNELFVESGNKISVLKKGRSIN